MERKRGVSSAGVWPDFACLSGAVSAIEPRLNEVVDE